MIVDEKIDEQWNGYELPVYNLTKKTGKTWWVDKIGTFSEFVPLLLADKIIREKDDEIDKLKAIILTSSKKVKDCIHYNEPLDYPNAKPTCGLGKPMNFLPTCPCNDHAPKKK